MQTIPLGVRVSVARAFRYTLPGDDAHWTGVVVDIDDNDGEQLCLVQFDEANQWWHVAATLTVLS